MLLISSVNFFSDIDMPTHLCFFINIELSYYLPPVGIVKLVGIVS